MESFLNATGKMQFFKVLAKIEDDKLSCKDFFFPSASTHVDKFQPKARTSSDWLYNFIIT